MHAERSGESLRVLVETGSSELRGDVDEARPACREPKPVFIVHAVVELRIERAEPLYYAASEEDGWLAEKAYELQPLARPRFGRVGADDAVDGVDMVSLAVDHVGGWILSERLENRGDGTVVIDIVGIEVREPLASGHRQACVDGVGLTAI